MEHPLQSQTLIDLNRELITVERARRLASVSRRTIYNWMDAGWLEFVYTPSGSRRIFADSLFKRKRRDAQ